MALLRRLFSRWLRRRCRWNAALHRKRDEVLSSYRIVMTPEYFGIVKRGAFDHWIGETVPLRGPDRQIIGEATVTDLDHREDGNVYLTVKTTVDDVPEVVARVTALIRGKNPMSISVKPDEVSLPHQPKRGDDVARWLKRIRNDCREKSSSWWVLDYTLDEYRARADFGLTLDDDITQLPDYGSGGDIARA